MVSAQPPIKSYLKACIWAFGSMSANIVLSNKTSKQNWRRQMHRELRLKNSWITYGIRKGFGLGISVSKYGLDIDFLMFYVGWQF